MRFTIPKGLLQLGEHKFGGSINHGQNEPIVQLTTTSARTFAAVMNALIKPKKTTPAELFDTTANMFVFALDIGDIYLQNILLRQFWKGSSGIRYSPLRRGYSERPTEEDEMVLHGDLVRSYARDDLQPLRRLLISGLAYDLVKREMHNNKLTLLDLSRYYEILERFKEEGCFTRFRTDLDEQLKKRVEVNKVDEYHYQRDLEIKDYLFPSPLDEA